MCPEEWLCRGPTCPPRPSPEGCLEPSVPSKGPGLVWTLPVLSCLASAECLLLSGAVLAVLGRSRERNLDTPDCSSEQCSEHLYNMRCSLVAAGACGVRWDRPLPTTLLIPRGCGHFESHVEEPAVLLLYVMNTFGAPFCFRN